MSRPYWLNDHGLPVEEGEPFAQHVRDYFHWLGLERMRAFRAELHYHGDAKYAKNCLLMGGCVAPCDHFRAERLDELAALAETSRQICAEARSGFEGAVLVTPPLCLMGETPANKSIKKYTDQWRKNHAY